ncbi:hypothetical protein ACI2L4_25055 [Streptomyces sparsogenes]|uniref:hypothetical protein n=1 Tax=Streptomyces sparsogenes TaxID=67365 RepID=UPI00384B7995
MEETRAEPANPADEGTMLGHNGAVMNLPPIGELRLPLLGLRTTIEWGLAKAADEHLSDEERCEGATNARDTLAALSKGLKVLADFAGERAKMEGETRDNREDFDEETRDEADRMWLVLDSLREQLRLNITWVDEHHRRATALLSTLT